MSDGGQKAIYVPTEGNLKHEKCATKKGSPSAFEFLSLSLAVNTQLINCCYHFVSFTFSFSDHLAYRQASCVAFQTRSSTFSFSSDC